MDCIIDLLRAPSEDVFMERRSLLEEAPKPFVETSGSMRTVRSHQHLGNSLSFERQRIGGERRYPVFSVFHPANA